MSKVDGHQSSLKNAGKLRLAHRCTEYLQGIERRVNDLQKMINLDGTLAEDERTSGEVWTARRAAIENAAFDYNGKPLNRNEVTAMLADLRQQLKANGVSL